MDDDVGSDDAGTGAAPLLEPPARERISRAVNALINAREQGIRYAETRLNSLALVSGGFIAAGIALLSVGLNEPGDITRPALLGAAVALFGLAVALLLAYARSTNPQYPFIDPNASVKQARWKWFYWDALPQASQFATFGRFGKLGEKEREAEVRAVDAQWPQFRETMLQRLGDEDQDLEEDLRQLYTLHINERYKNAYLSNVRTILQKGLAVILAVTILAGLGAYIVDALKDTGIRGSATGRLSSGVRYEEKWRQTSVREGEVTLSLRMSIINTTSDVQRFVGLTARDRAGYELPIVTSPVALVVNAHASAEMTLDVKVPRSYAPKIAVFEPK